jgi:hypothetical protein
MGGLLGIVLRATGARYFTAVLFSVYIVVDIYQAFWMALAAPTSIPFLASLLAPAILAWIVVAFFTKTVKLYFQR